MPLAWGRRDRADEPGLELDGEDADLLPIGRDVVRQDLELGVQRAKAVVELGHIGLDRQPDHEGLIVGRRGLGPGRGERLPHAAPDVDLVGQSDRDQPVVDVDAASYPPARDPAFAVRGGAEVCVGGIEGDGREEKTAGRAGERAGLVDAGDRLAEGLVRCARGPDELIELRFAIEPPPLSGDGRSRLVGRL